MPTYWHIWTRILSKFRGIKAEGLHGWASLFDLSNQTIKVDNLVGGDFS
jgi:hypothetical protein